MIRYPYSTIRDVLGGSVLGMSNVWCETEANLAQRLYDTLQQKYSHTHNLGEEA